MQQSQWKKEAEEQARVKQVHFEEQQAKSPRDDIEDVVEVDPIATDGTMALSSNKTAVRPISILSFNTAGVTEEKEDRE